MLTPFHIKASQCAIVGACFIIFGVATTFYLAVRINKTKVYMFYYNLLAFIAIAAAVALIYVVPTEKFGAILTCCSFVGVGLIPVNSVGLLIVVEFSHPVSE